MPHVSFEKPRPRVGGKVLFELVPSTTWYQNARSELSKEHWDLIRKWVYRRARYVCDVCGGVGPKHPVECHEVWAFKQQLDGKNIQKLVGFIALCPKCHQVKHLGHSRHNLSATKFKRVLSHQRRINKWKKLKQVREWDKATAEYRRRSLVKWEVDLSYAWRLVHRIQMEQGVG